MNKTRRRKISRRKPRVSKEEFKRILEVLKSFERGERTDLLTWERLEELVERPRRTLMRHDQIYKAFWSAKAANIPIEGARRKSTNEHDRHLGVRIAKLELEVKEAERKRDRAEERLLRLIDAVEARGFNAEELITAGARTS